MKRCFSFNLKLAFDFKKSSTPLATESGEVNTRVDPSIYRKLITLLEGLMPWIKLLYLCVAAWLYFSGYKAS